MKNKNQTVFVQMLAFFTAALSVIFLRQYYQGKSNIQSQHIEQQTLPFTQHAKIFLESAEVNLDEEIIIRPVK